MKEGDLRQQHGKRQWWVTPHGQGDTCFYTRKQMKFSVLRALSTLSTLISIARTRGCILWGDPSGEREGHISSGYFPLDNQSGAGTSPSDFPFALPHQATEEPGEPSQRVCALVNMLGTSNPQLFSRLTVCGNGRQRRIP